ncbi:hypothetical protein AVEN_64321-1, partial [Araneus ventricosus]
MDLTYQARTLNPLDTDTRLVYTVVAWWNQRVGTHLLGSRTWYPQAPKPRPHHQANEALGNPIGSKGNETKTLTWQKQYSTNLIGRREATSPSTKAQDDTCREWAAADSDPKPA